MSAVLFSPHNDDETLFAFYTMVRYKPSVIVVLRSMRQQIQQNGPTYQQREAETLVATRIAGVEYVQWTGFTDDSPDWWHIEKLVHGNILLSNPDVVIAPAWEDGGHEDHNALAEICANAPGEHELVRYLTYRRGHGRSEWGEEVVPTPGERAAKRAALGCYASQAEHPPTASWFADEDDQREFVAP